MLAYTGMGTWARRRWSPRPSRRAASATGTATPIDGITLSAGILGENARRAAVRRGERPLSAHGLRRADQVDLAPRCPAGAWDTTGHAAVGAELAKAAEPVISRLLGEQPCSREYSSMTWTILHCRRVSTWSGSVRLGGSALFIIRPPPQWSLPACDADRRSAGRPRRARAPSPRTETVSSPQAPSWWYGDERFEPTTDAAPGRVVVAPSRSMPAGHGGDLHYMGTRSARDPGRPVCASGCTATASGSRAACGSGDQRHGLVLAERGELSYRRCHASRRGDAWTRGACDAQLGKAEVPGSETTGST